MEKETGGTSGYCTVTLQKGRFRIQLTVLGLWHTGLSIKSDRGAYVIYTSGSTNNEVIAWEDQRERRRLITTAAQAPGGWLEPAGAGDPLWADAASDQCH